MCDEVLERRERFLRRFCERYGWRWDDVRRAIRWAVWFHDIGKAADEWQGYIRSERGRVTHALVSFAVGLNALGLHPGRFEPTAPFAALFAILAHHMQLFDGAFREERYRRELHLPVEFLREHQHRFEAMEPRMCRQQWGWPIFQLQRAGQAVDLLKTGVRQADTTFKALYSLLLNLLKMCDESASRWLSDEGSPERPLEACLTRDQLGGIRDRFPLYDPEPLKHLSFVPTPNPMQRELGECDADRVILNAGCGEGKTAAALLFAQKWMRQDRVDRLIFTLPTKFTANNLYRDLTEKYGIPQQLVGITHGDSEEFLRQLADEDGDSSLRDQVFENNFYAKPITLSTVDHLIMSLYHGYKYADRAFFNVASSLVVFDEVHYYEGITLSAIAEAMKALSHLHVPHLVMTATIPTSVRRRMDRLYRAKDGDATYHFLRAPAEVPGQRVPKRPFRIERLSAPLFDEDRTPSDEVLELVEGHVPSRQIVFVNQVARAKSMYEALRDRSACENLICYHAGFISSDRQRKERLIRSLFKPSAQRTSEECENLEAAGFTDSDTCVLVSTQISELSLDISADVMVSEAAPVDSLVQRGGRLHRNGWSPQAVCGADACVQRGPMAGHVYRLVLAPPYDDPKLCRPYEAEVLQRSWGSVGEVYSFQDACGWVDQVYPESEVLLHANLEQAIRADLVFGKRPQENYGESAEEEGRVVIRQQSYQTYDVVPLKFADVVEDDYREYKTHHLSVSAGAFWAARQSERIFVRKSALCSPNWRGTSREKEIPFLVINADYSFEVGLMPEEVGVANLL